MARLLINAQHKRHAGFSLLELLLVLVIVGLIVSITGISVTSGSKPYAVDGAIRVFADVAEYAMEEAQLSGYDMGLQIEQTQHNGVERYSFAWLQRRPEGWVAPAQDRDIFAQQYFPLDVQLELELEQSLTDLPLAVNDDEAPVQPPQVIFYSSGETTPGVLRLRQQHSGKLLWELEWDLIAQMQLRREGLEDDAG